MGLLSHVGGMHSDAKSKRVFRLSNKTFIKLLLLLTGTKAKIVKSFLDLWKMKKY